MPPDQSKAKAWLLKMANAVARYPTQRHDNVRVADTPAAIVQQMLEKDVPADVRPAIRKVLPPVLESDWGMAAGQLREAAGRLDSSRQ